MYQELEFIKKWGMIFKQAFADQPLKPYLKYHYQTCVDTFQILSNKKPCFNTDLDKGLKNLENYFLYLDSNDESSTVNYERSQYVLLIHESVKSKRETPQLSLF